MSGEIKFPAGFGLNDVVAWGTTGLVIVHKPSVTVIKTPLFDDCSDLVLRERDIYERLTQLGGHQGLLRYYGTSDGGIKLEYVSKGNLRYFISQNKPDVNLRRQWAIQIAEALDFVHKAGVFHGDLTCQNVFLDEKLHARLADFAGSSLDGSPLLVAVTASHEYPGSALSAQGDLFAFGSVLYEIMTENAPYLGPSEDEIQARYSKGEFPETDSLRSIGGIIRMCWQAQYDDCDLVLRDLRGLLETPSNTIAV